MGVTPRYFKGRVEVGKGLWEWPRRLGNKIVRPDNEVSNDFHAHLCVARRVEYQND
jgi:hypothetical protein